MECLIHYDDVTESSLINLNERNIVTLKDCAQQWLLTDGCEKQIVQQRLETWGCLAAEITAGTCNYGYHRKCYSRFTNKINIERQISSKRKLITQNQALAQELPETAQKVLRSSATFKHSVKSTSSPLLPMLCIICGKRNRNLRKSQQKRFKRKKDILQVALTKDAGKLLSCG